MTDEIDLRLKNSVIHLNDENWEPWFPTVEVMLEGTSINNTGDSESNTAPLARRKAIADRMNQYLAENEEQGIQLGQQIRGLETKLNDDGLELFEFSELINARNATAQFAWNSIWFLLLFPVSVLGTLHHIVPFTIVRALSKRIQSKVNRTDVSLYRLLFSIPIYLLTYAGIGYLLTRQTNLMTAVVWLSLAPFAGIIALEYWPALGRFVKKCRRRKQLSRQGATLQQAEKEYFRLSKEIQQISASMESN